MGKLFWALRFGLYLGVLMGMLSFQINLRTASRFARSTFYPTCVMQHGTHSSLVFAQSQLASVFPCLGLNPSVLVLDMAWSRWQHWFLNIHSKNLQLQEGPLLVSLGWRPQYFLCRFPLWRESQIEHNFGELSKEPLRNPSFQDFDHVYSHRVKWLFGCLTVLDF